MQQAVDVLHDAEPPHQVVTLQQAADALQLLLLTNVDRFGRVDWLLADWTLLITNTCRMLHMQYTCSKTVKE